MRRSRLSKSQQPFNMAKPYIHEREKHEGRIKDIVAKGNGDQKKEIALATTQATRIGHSDKAQNRAAIAKEMGYPHLEKTFYIRFLDLTQTRAQILDRMLNDPDYWLDTQW